MILNCCLAGAWPDSEVARQRHGARPLARALAIEQSRCHAGGHVCSERRAQRIDVFPAAAAQLPVTDLIVHQSHPPLPNVDHRHPQMLLWLFKINDYY